LLHRQVGGLGTLENLDRIKPVLTVNLDEALAIAQHAACNRKFAKLVDSWESSLCCEANDAITADIEIRIGCDEQRTDTIAHESGKCSLKLFVCAGLGDHDTLADRTCRVLDVARLTHPWRKIWID